MFNIEHFQEDDMYKDTDISQALQAARGNISVAAKSLGCSHSTIYRRLKENEVLQEVLDNEREAFIDFAESKLQDLISDGNLTATIFFLKTQARHRGYGGGSGYRGPFDPKPEPYNSLNSLLLDPVLEMKMDEHPPFDSLPITDDDDEEE